MLRLLSIILILLSTNIQYSLQAQILYKVNFHDKNLSRYEGLLVYFNESRSYMRINYHAENSKYQVVNVNYKSSTGTFSDGSVYFFMSGYSPKFITEDSAGQKYNPDHFIWRKGKTEQTWNNPSTTDDPKLSYASEIPVDSFFQINPYSVSETFLRKFFWDNEPDYFSLRRLCGLVDITINPVNTTGTKLHLVVVANTLIGDIGPSCKADRDKLDYEFRSIAEALGISYQKYFADENNFNKTYVQNTLKSIKSGSDDIVVFVYRGHGFRWNNQTDAYPMMDLRTSNYVNIDKTTSMGLSEVYNTLKNKNARLNIILGDCCNNYVGLNQTTTTSFLNSQSDNKPDIKKLRGLFVDARGTLICAAARKGEYSWANPFGGFFTLSFIQAMKEKISYFNNNNSSWNDVITYATKLAKDKSSPQLCSNCTLQTGVSYVNVSY
ncbi:MAG: caspase family protein [Chitinophagaceae bacterium]|nr:caspase family protein [Chitinophagaceae bacterium]MBK8951171.1 caspase family protein [Chitinophagaceae bacterium]